MAVIERDIIIVGGGPAGSSAAWELRRRGMDCLVLDRETFPREKLCAGWITPEVLSDLAFEPADYPHRFLTFEVLNIYLKGLKVPLRSPQHSVRRFEFDRWLLERSGAEVHQYNVRRVEKDGDGYRLDDAYRCRHLIGAGGTRCPVFRDLFRADQPRPKGLQAVTLELEFPFRWRDANCHLWFLSKGLPGYAWYVPKADGYLNVGVGGMAEKLRHRGDEIRRHWDLLIDRLLADGLIDAAPDRPNGYSYFLRGGTVNPRNDNAFIAGDAAGLATRDMCEGIGPAVRSGLLAARAIIDGAPYDFSGIGAFTAGNRWVQRGLEYLFVG
jgi:flavin-dependent dehydrogenase